MSEGYTFKPLPAPEMPTAKYDPATGRITMSVPLDAEAFARLVDNLYADGLSHEEATAWLEANVPDFRAHVILVHLDGRTRWMHAGLVYIVETS